ncbi:hypothetical protein HYFRA_00010772 [Hymenoscyphus fraxineus]|uniref:Uncharacterized protein n=1 Tax=Hymenoscyphus fraxineus TaxID=746836 RepID=A0A9N9L2C8_9HELO|nr:hypothetical protein HYFRA_00010772 [Hymenoscyphus fraxineus]
MLALTKYLCISAICGLAIAAPVSLDGTIQSLGSETVSRDITYASGASNRHVIAKRCLGKRCVEVIIINEGAVADVEAAKVTKRCAGYKCLEATIISEERAVEVANKKVVTRGCLGTKCVEIIIVKEESVVEDTD